MFFRPFFSPLPVDVVELSEFADIIWGLTTVSSTRWLFSSRVPFSFVCFRSYSSASVRVIEIICSCFLRVLVERVVASSVVLKVQQGSEPQSEARGRQLVGIQPHRQRRTSVQDSPRLPRGRRESRSFYLRRWLGH